MNIRFCMFFLVLLVSSCMKDIPDELPEELVWEPQIAIPVGKDRFALDAESGFDTTLFELDTLSNLPEWVGSVNVVLEGRMEFDLSSLESSHENIKRILFRVGMWNGFPDGVQAQAYFYGPDPEAIDSIFSEGPLPLEAGTPVGIGDSVSPSYLIRDALVEEDRIISLSDADLIIFRATILGPGSDTSLIPYYRNYYLEAEMGCMLDLSLEF